MPAFWRSYGWASALALAVITGLSGCVAHTRGEIVYGYEAEYVEAPPPRIEYYPRAVYRGQPAYWVDGRWYYRDRSRWLTFRDEPAELRDYRLKRREGFYDDRRSSPSYRRDRLEQRRLESRRAQERRRHEEWRAEERRREARRAEERRRAEEGREQQRRFDARREKARREEQQRRFADRRDEARRDREERRRDERKRKRSSRDRRDHERERDERNR